MPPFERLATRANEGVITPDYLGPHDHLWLASLIEEHHRFVGKPTRELEQHLREPLACPSPTNKRHCATRVLAQLVRDRSRPSASPRKIRSTLFSMAAARPEESAQSVRRAAAAALQIDAKVIDENLFADIPKEKPIAALPAGLSASELALRTNLSLVQGLLRRATDVRIDIRGNARRIVRIARLRGLICVPERSTGNIDTDVTLKLSGPMTLFRRTLIYGRSLASLVPHLAWCERYMLVARCALRDGPVPIVVRSGDPIFPASEPKRFDSKLEKRFAREFGRAAPDWDLIREPEPVDTGSGLIFPDFAIEHRRDRRRRWLLEIVGFWTPEYLDKKLRSLSALEAPRLIVCVDQDRACGPEELGAMKPSPVVQFRRRIRPDDIIRIIEDRL